MVNVSESSQGPSSPEMRNEVEQETADALTKMVRVRTVRLGSRTVNRRSNPGSKTAPKPSETSSEMNRETPMGSVVTVSSP